MSAAVKCDNCGWYAESPPGWSNMDYRNLPTGWVELRHATAGEDNRVAYGGDWKGGAFCRIECAAAYMAKQAAAERSEASTATESET